MTRFDNSQASAICALGRAGRLGDLGDAFSDHPGSGVCAGAKRVVV
jgi:hypothetical protein